MPIARQPVHGGVRLLEQRTLRTLQASQARLVKFEVGEEEFDMSNIMDFEVKIEKRLKSIKESGKTLRIVDYLRTTLVLVMRGLYCGERYPKTEV